MATLIQYGQVGKPIKMNSLPQASPIYKGTIVLINDVLYMCVVNSQGSCEWATVTVSEVS